MITSVHTLVYSDDPPATRAFFRDVLQWPFVDDEGGSSTSDEWLIFGTGRSELGGAPDLRMCEDIEATVADSILLYEPKPRIADDL